MDAGAVEMLLRAGAVKFSLTLQPPVCPRMMGGNILDTPCSTFFMLTIDFTTFKIGFNAKLP